MIQIIILTTIILTLTFVYITGRSNERYWQRRGVKFHKKNKVAGVFWDFLTQRRPLFQIFHEIYKEYPDDPAVGIGSFLTPAVYVKDPLNIQHILQSDFHSFNHRGVEISDGDLLADNILFMYGPRWKLVRQTMTPLFTSAKLKNMFYIMDKSAQDFVEYLDSNPDRQKRDTYNTLSTFCNAAVGAAVFGIGTNSIFDSPFLKMARETFKPSIWTNIRFSISLLSSWLYQVLKLKLFAEHQDFFISSIKKVIRIREKENVIKHDFVDLCVSLQKNGTLIDSDTGLKLEPSDELLAAQGFFFFVAGIEPTASGMFGTFIELGRNPEILERLHKEIDEVFEKHNGELTYDIISDMDYLEKVVSEGFRIFPPIAFNTRKCIHDTVLPVGNIKIDKGTQVYVPIYELHMDPKYFPNPDVFDPERFARDSKKLTNDAVYMPFGKGNRICIGLRYARLQIKAGIIRVLREYTLNTVVRKGGIKFRNDQVQMRLLNVDVEFIPRRNR